MRDLARSISEATLTAYDSYVGNVDNADPRLMETFSGPSRRLLEGGKRVRGLLSVAGAMCAGDDPHRLERAIEVAAALELFQGAALVHDDIMDESPTRRGIPAVHRAFALGFDNDGLTGDADRFGRDAGICSGDFLLAISTTHILSHAPMSAVARFQSMCAEVAYGQYLDVRAENIDLAHALTLEESDARTVFLQARSNAFAVLRHKSAHYSVRDPLLIGAHAAGASEELLGQLSAVGAPLGEAFQLRDDALGINGDPEITGKPIGGDIREGKRTVLTLTALAATAGTEEAGTIVSSLGRDVSDREVRMITDIMMSSGAWQEHEDLIAQRESAAHAVWKDLGPGPGRDLLGELMDRLTSRTA